ncbi:MAG: glycosyltransferase family 2 protein [Chloroflexota bacterium]
MSSSSISPEVSVLIPVYNAERYLSECLGSVTGQTLRDLEIICINDGSTDNSMDIIESAAVKDPRIVVIDKENSGYGDSLNQGLERATGSYMGIIEADDFADAPMYKKLFRVAANSGADIVKSDFFEYSNGLSRKAGIIPMADANKLMSPCEDTAIFRAQPSIWSALYSRNFIESNRVAFTTSPGASFQDTAFNLKTLAVSDKVWLIDDAYVHYRRDNDGSSIHSNDKVFAVCDEYDEFERYIDGYPDRFAKISDVLQAVRFETYSWNLSRLSGVAQQSFFRHMHEKFRSLCDEGFVDYAEFSDEEHPLLTMLLDGNQEFIDLSVQAREAKFGIDS